MLARILLEESLHWHRRMVEDHINWSRKLYENHRDWTQEQQGKRRMYQPQCVASNEQPEADFAQEDRSNGNPPNWIDSHLQQSKADLDNHIQQAQEQFENLLEEDREN